MNHFYSYIFGEWHEGEFYEISVQAESFEVGRWDVNIEVFNCHNQKTVATIRQIKKSKKEIDKSIEYLEQQASIVNAFKYYSKELVEKI